MIQSVKKIVPETVKEFYKEIAGLNFIENYYKATHRKKALISYVNKPFFSKGDFKHTNLHEARAIADVFHSLKYNVDLINFTKAKAFKPELYDVIFGLGEAVEFALVNRRRNQKRFPTVIWHGTGANPFVTNPATIQRLKYSYEKTGILLCESTRFLDKVYPLSYIFSDLIILYGNDFTKRTYAEHSFAPIETINPTCYVTTEHSRKKPNKNNYIWFGSAGAVHKGLDLLLDFFSGRPDLILHVCGDLRKEPNFAKLYHTQLRKTSNIHYHGFVDVTSNQFKVLMELCCFTVLPSCSEGTATSVITTMANGGLIPLVTENAGIDINHSGILIEGLSLHQIEKAINASQELSLGEIEKRSNEIALFCRQNYTIENFAINFKNILIKHLTK